jgi:hypothetical protein
MAITITTIGGNAVISADGTNPGLIITPTGEVQVGVETAVSTATPTQLVTAQNVIDYVQGGGLPAALSAGDGEELFYGIDIPLSARRVTVAFNGSPTISTRAVNCWLEPYVFQQGSNGGGTGACAAIGGSAVSWTTLGGVAVTTTAVSTSSVMYGVVRFERVPLQGSLVGQDAVRQSWIMTSQVGLTNAATQFVSSGVCDISGYQSQEITNLRVRCSQSGGYVFAGVMSVVVES